MSKTFGINVRKYRRMLNMTQKELASMVGYTARQTICLIEQGKINPSIEMTKKIADALSVTPRDLIDFTSDDIEIAVYEYLPYLQNAEEWQLKAVREILKMPAQAQKNGNSSTMVG